MATKIIFSTIESACYKDTMFPIQAQKKIASYKENNQEQRANDSLSNLIICDHPLSKTTKTKKNKNEDQQEVSRLWVYFKWSWIKPRSTQVWSNLKQQRNSMPN